MWMKVVGRAGLGLAMSVPWDSFLCNGYVGMPPSACKIQFHAVEFWIDLCFPFSLLVVHSDSYPERLDPPLLTW